MEMGIPGIVTALVLLLICSVKSQENKFTGGPNDIKSEHTDFVLLRMNYLLGLTPSNITQLRAAIEEELAASTIYKAAWEEGTAMFQAKKNDLIDPNYPVPDEYHIALIAYTLHDTPPESPFFSDFNKRTRELCSGNDINDKYPYKTFFKLLALAISALSKSPKFQADRPSYYRGAGIPFALAVGQELAFQHFVSSTTDLKQAEQYSSNTTLFEIEGPYTPANSISMVHHSKFPEEAEVLVTPLIAYQVKSIHRGSMYTRFVLIPKAKPSSILASVLGEDSAGNSNSVHGMILAICFSVFVAIS